MPDGAWILKNDTEGERGIVTKDRLHTILIAFIAAVLFAGLMFTCAAEALADDPEAPEISYVNDDTEFCIAVSGMPKQSGSAGESGGVSCARRLLVVCEEVFDCTGIEGLTEAVFDDDGLCVMQFDSVSDAKTAYYDLQKKKEVLSVEFDAQACTEQQSAGDIDALAVLNGHLSWGVDFIGADAYSEYLASVSRRKLTVAVVDTGADMTHPFLQSRLKGGYDFVRGDSIPDDEDGHGTHVAGIIADCTPGLNEISIMPVKVLDDAGEGRISDIGSGLMYAADNGAKVINLSVTCYHSAYLDVLISRILDKGNIVVAAAGNEGMNISSIGACPAHIEELITVGAVNRNKTVGYYSNFGSMIDVVAPGTAITGAYPVGSYITYTGTSMAAPHASACAAMLKLRYPKANCRQIESILKRSCDDIEGTAHDGSGVINMRNLISDISSQKVTLLSKKYVYSGKPVTADIRITRNGENLLEGYDYSVTYKNNKKAGIATAIIRGDGSYSGSATVSFRIVPKGTSIRSISPVRKGFSIKWKKRSLQTDGYQIQYSRNKNFSNAKLRTVKDTDKVTYIKRKLKSGKKYYVRIRTYKVVNGKKYCSSWSKRRSVKTK